MNFAFPERCTTIRTEVRRVLDRICTMDEVRRSLDRGVASEKTWKALADLGVLATAIPEEWGGTGLGALELAACAEEIGRVCAPVPMLPSVYLATEALLMGGTEAQKDRWMPRLAIGDGIGTVVATAPSLRFEGGRATGHLAQVPAGMAANFVIVHGPSFAACIDLRQRGIRREPRQVIDPGYPIARVDFDGTPFESLERPIDAVVDRAAIFLAFDQIGGADRALAMARDYALARRVFGRTVASYQAIKHKLADVWVKNEIARGHAWFGAWALSGSADVLPSAAAAARVSASEAFEHAAQENIQVHGGVGFTWEADCHPYYKRARSTALALGSSVLWRAKLAESLHRRRDVVPS